MNKFLGMSVLALAIAGLPTQTASAFGGGGGNFRLGFGFHFNFEFGGLVGPWCGHGCGHGHGRRAHYIATFPGMEHNHAAAEQPAQPFPPAPAPMPEPDNGEQKRGERRSEEAAAYWGYPSLNYTYHHPVSYYPAANQAQYYPSNYYPTQHYYPAPYQAPGMSFDR